MNPLKNHVLKSFKNLHLARKKVFEGDERALKACREKINSEFAQKKHVQDLEAIKELLAYARDVEKQLLTTVIQARMVSPNKFEARITKDTVKLDNVPFRDCCEGDRKPA
ncbi:complex III assembly factor LYRM7 [Ischnura elegans]|uniref:complex III assembly factor LYRM7 n=1 Tax=Ischnura elegans TaxID=197161 RepID=UPI001ED8A2FC|nr:complex III assembly factor LYRM7 [Ischnura elegans]